MTGDRARTWVPTPEGVGVLLSPPAMFVTAGDDIEATIRSVRANLAKLSLDLRAATAEADAAERAVGGGATCAPVDLRRASPALRRALEERLARRRTEWARELVEARAHAEQRIRAAEIEADRLLEAARDRLTAAVLHGGTQRQPASPMPVPLYAADVAWGTPDTRPPQAGLPGIVVDPSFAEDGAQAGSADEDPWRRPPSPPPPQWLTPPSPFAPAAAGGPPPVAPVVAAPSGPRTIVVGHPVPDSAFAPPPAAVPSVLSAVVVGAPTPDAPVDAMEPRTVPVAVVPAASAHPARAVLRERFLHPDILMPLVAVLIIVVVLLAWLA